MQIHTALNLNATRWLYIFLIIHLLAWTLVPALVRLNLPLDAIEGTIWGHQLEWGYDKNPYLNGWLTALAVYFNGTSGWTIYLFSQLSVIACLWSVWQIAKRMIPSVYALLAVLLLEGLQYFNFHAIDFNDNTLELGLWGLASYFFYRALNCSKIISVHLCYIYWVLTGLCLGLGLMAKYYTVTLIVAMALLLLSNAQYRKQLITLPPYLGLSAFLLVILPHFVWLFSHNFVTVTYVFARASSVPSWTNHFFFPAQFMWQQLEVLLPALILLALFLIGKKPLLLRPRFIVAAADQRFLWFVGLGPLILTTLLSLCLGIKLRAGWGMPLLSLTSIILVTVVQPKISIQKLYGFLILIFSIIAIMLGMYANSLINSKETSTANFPGKMIAETITQQWQERYHTPLAFVAGSRWVGGNIGFYSKDHPAVFINWNPKQAPWVDLNTMREKGAVFVWEISANESLPESIQKKFPTLSNATVHEFSWQRNSYQLPPVKLGIAFLPPELSASSFLR